MLTSFDGGRLFGQLHGSERPNVLALHGWRRDHRDFAQVLDGLDAIALDLPGFGGTPAPDQPWGSDQYADALAALLSEMAPGVVVIGHSFGGRVAVHLAARHHEAVRGVVLTGAPLFPALAASGAKPRRPPLSYRAVRRLARSGLISERRLEDMKQRHGSADYRAATGVMRDVLVKAIAEERAEAYTPSLRALTCPVELVWGALDTAAPPPVAERIRQEVPGPVALHVLDGIGHLTPEAAPAELRAAIDRLVVTAA